MTQEEYEDWYFNKREKKSWHPHKEDLTQGWGQGGRTEKTLPHPRGKNPDDIIQTKQDFIHNRKGSYDDPLHTRPNHPLGKNPSDFWDITTRGYPEAHFAVFPEELVERPIKTTPKWICKKCGKARERINERKGEIIQQWGERKKKPWFEDKREMPQKIIKEGIYETVGWTICNCNAGFRPAVIMDIFVGSGITLDVARRLGRDSIGIEIKKEYCDLTFKRLYKGNIPLDKNEFKLIK